MLEKNAGQLPLCLITGGAKRIGAEIARGLAGSFRIALHYHDSRDEAANLAAELKAAGAEVTTFDKDLSKPQAATELAEQVMAEMGNIDLLVNNASRFTYDSPSSFDGEILDELCRVNLTAPVALAKAVAEHATTRHDGGEALVVQMLDNKVFALNPDFFSYTLTKCALHASVQMLAMHYPGRLRVCGIAPGVTLASGEQDRANFETSWRRSLSGRGATPAEIAQTVLFLWNSPSINGETIVLDGGQRHMHLERDVAFVVE